MQQIKTPEQIVDLNFNDLAFFKGITTSEAKWEMANLLYSEKDLYEIEHEDGSYKNLNKSGIPIIKKTERLKKSLFETKIKSCSNLEGKNHIDFIIKSFNKPIPLQKLKEFSESKTFSKALKFTGKHEILNEILNRDQYLILQKSWLFSNAYLAYLYSDKTKFFVKNNPWAINYLVSKGIEKSEILEKLKN